MKYKFFKKLIAVLCAATMSMSVVTSAGAICYSNGNELSNTETKFISDLNNKIFNLGQNVIEMKTIVSGLNNINIPNKQNMLNQLDSIYNKLTSMYNENLSCPNKKIIVNFNNLISPIKTNIEQTLNLLRAGNISVNNFNSNIYSIDTQLKKLYQDTINAIQTYNMNNNAKNTMDNQFKNEFNKNNIIKNNNMFYYHQDMMTINKVRPNAIAMRDRMLTKDIDPHATALQIKLTNKWEELQNRFKDARIFAKHRKISDQPIQNIKNKFFIDYTNLDPFNKDVATIQQAITLIDNNIKLLNEFTFNNDFTVVIPNQTSGLKRKAEIKKREMFRLIDCCKRSYNPYFFGNQFTNQAIQFYNGINLKNPNLNELSTQLNQAIKNFDFAISTIKKFDDNKKSNVTIWQEEASKDITPLLNQAIKEMKKSPNQTTVKGIVKEFTPLLCGVQHFGNCWLYAIRNVMNFGSHIQNQNNNIVKNTGAQDANGFDEVEKFFATVGLSGQSLKNRGGNILQQSELLSNLGINHSVVKIYLEKNDKQSLEVNTKIVKTLLLKHFSNSITPVLINNRYDECSFDVGNRSGGNHAMTIVGLDISTNSVVVADSNHKNLQVYSLDRIASTICNRGMTDQTVKDIEMIFPSFTNMNNFNYDNTIHSWNEFKSKLLPAISKSF